MTTAKLSLGQEVHWSIGNETFVGKIIEFSRPGFRFLGPRLRDQGVLVRFDGGAMIADPWREGARIPCNYQRLIDADYELDRQIREVMLALMDHVDPVIKEIDDALAYTRAHERLPNRISETLRNLAFENPTWVEDNNGDGTWNISVRIGALHEYRIACARGTS